MRLTRRRAQHLPLPRLPVRIELRRRGSEGGGKGGRERKGRRGKARTPAPVMQHARKVVFPFLCAVCVRQGFRRHFPFASVFLRVDGGDGGERGAGRMWWRGEAGVDRPRRRSERARQLCAAWAREGSGRRGGVRERADRATLLLAVEAAGRELLPLAFSFLVAAMADVFRQGGRTSSSWRDDSGRTVGGQGGEGSSGGRSFPPVLCYFFLSVAGAFSRPSSCFSPRNFRVGDWETPFFSSLALPSLAPHLNLRCPPLPSPPPRVPFADLSKSPSQS